MKKILNNLLDFIMPQFCLGCKIEGSLCCGYCFNDILLEETSITNWPEQSDFYFDACHICCHYENKLVQKLLKNYKYAYIENLAETLIILLEKQSRRLSLPKNTIITNVPLHKKKRKQRGFDQTEILAKGLAQKLNLEYYPLLKRIKQTKTQAQLSKQARQDNVVNVFEIYKSTTFQKIQNNQPILLIDDITTTGSTLNQSAKILRKAGYQKIICLVLAKN